MAAAGPSGLFQQVSCQGEAMVRDASGGLLDGFCCLLDKDGKPAGEPVRMSASAASGRCGPVRLGLRHRLLDSAAGFGPDTLEATLTLENTSSQTQKVDAGFTTAARPCADAAGQRAWLPVSAAAIARDERFAELGAHGVAARGRLRPWERSRLQCHYLEPAGSDPLRRSSRAMILAPVVDLFAAKQPWRVAMFASSLEPFRFESIPQGGSTVWRGGRIVQLAPGEKLELRGWLLVHQGDASAAWKAFHRFAHKEDFAPVSWLREVRVLYYDFLSAAEPDGRRGGGYDVDLPHFREFRVGVANQHGYYPAVGDYINPDRKTWQAMRSDKRGPAEMSLALMKARVDATRKAGVHPAVYLDLEGLDDASPLFASLADAVRVDDSGKPVRYIWQGPDTVGKAGTCRARLAAWREHLVQQARWIMELLNPDAIIMDNTFGALGYDYHRDRPGPTSAGGIELMRKLRAAVRSFGPDKAFLTSDCAMSGMVLWADGEAGDHGQPSMLGHSLYRQVPVSYLAALGEKRWLPCAWPFQAMWRAQMDLARKTGAGVGVSNGWYENTGLTRLPKAFREQALADIRSL